MSSAVSASFQNSRIIGPIGEKDFEICFNEKPFTFNHCLAEKNFFTLDHIAYIARKMLQSGRKDVFAALNFEQAELGSKFTSLPAEKQFSNAVESLPEKGSWIKLSRAQDFEPYYKQLLEIIIDDIEKLSGVEIRPDLTWSTMTLFLASPGISTPYHIDHESNILLQIQGSKDVCLFDQNDRELLPDQEIENFYNGNSEAARYREEYQSRGTVFRLDPGVAVHHPPLAPHWVKNGNETSISVSIGFCLRPLEKRARIYQANYLLRRLGFYPRHFSDSNTADSVKAKVMNMLEKKNAKTYRDVVFGPMDRLKAPVKASLALFGF